MIGVWTKINMEFESVCLFEGWGYWAHPIFRCMRFPQNELIEALFLMLKNTYFDGLNWLNPCSWYNPVNSLFWFLFYASKITPPEAIEVLLDSRYRIVDAEKVNLMRCWHGPGILGVPKKTYCHRSIETIRIYMSEMMRRVHIFVWYLRVTLQKTCGELCRLCLCNLIADISEMTTTWQEVSFPISADDPNMMPKG